MAPEVLMHLMHTTFTYKHKIKSFNKRGLQLSMVVSKSIKSIRINEMILRLWVDTNDTDTDTEIQLWPILILILISRLKNPNNDTDTDTF